MGALDLFRSLSRDQRFAGVTGRPTNITGLPWQNPAGPLQPLVIDDVFGDMVDLVDRGNALKVPAISRARALLVGSIADLPLVAYRNQDRVDDQPPWLYRSSYVSPWHRMAYTIDDLLFYDCSLWWRDNNADGFPAETYRIPIEQWQIDEVSGRILVRDSEGEYQPVPAENVIYIPGPGSPLLTSAADTIRGARQIDRSWIARTRSPIPPTLFRQTEKDNVEADDVMNLTKAWSAARQNPETAGVGFIPYGIEAVFPHVADDSQMFIEGRNAVRLDIANLTNIPASLLDGSTATASLTYETQEGQRSSFHEQTIRYWTAPIEHRLSMGDIVPRGQRVRFDITYLTQVPPTGEPGED